MFGSQSVCLIGSLQKKPTTKKRKRGAEKEQARTQSSVLTRRMKNCQADVNAMNDQAEIPNQATEEGQLTTFVQQI